MEKFKVLADSTCDIEKEYRERFGFDYCKMVFRSSSKDYDADIDWGQMTAAEFYGSMRKGESYTTGLVQTTELEAKFKEIFEEGKDVLYVACSSALSGSINNGKLVAEELASSYPGRKVLVLDPLRSCCSQGLIAKKAVELAKEGKDVEEAFAILEEEKANYRTYATVGSLNWLKKAGRVKASAAFFGNLFGVKPILIQDTRGSNYAYKKVKGRKTSLDEIIAEVKENIVNASEQIVFVQHADCLKDAEYVANAIKEQVNPKEVAITNVGPIIGSCTGPDTIIVDFYGKKVTITGEE